MRVQRRMIRRAPTSRRRQHRLMAAARGEPARRLGHRSRPKVPWPRRWRRHRRRRPALRGAPAKGRAYAIARPARRRVRPTRALSRACRKRSPSPLPRPTAQPLPRRTCRGPRARAAGASHCRRSAASSSQPSCRSRWARRAGSGRVAAALCLEARRAARCSAAARAGRSWHASRSHARRDPSRRRRARGAGAWRRWAAPPASTWSPAAAY